MAQTSFTALAMNTVVENQLRAQLYLAQVTILQLTAQRDLLANLLRQQTMSSTTLPLPAPPMLAMPLVPTLALPQTLLPKTVVAPKPTIKAKAATTFKPVPPLVDDDADDEEDKRSSAPSPPLTPLQEQIKAEIEKQLAKMQVA